MESCEEVCKGSKSKRGFVQSWLNDDRFKDWLRQVPNDESQYHCTICNQDFSCNASRVSSHTESACHENSLKRLIKDMSTFKFWLGVVPDDASMLSCKICGRTFVAKLSQVRRHARSRKHFKMCKRKGIEMSESNDDTQDANLQGLTQDIENLLLFDERKNIAEMQFAALVAENDIPFQTAEELLSLFQSIDKDVLKSMKMD
ncbi:hypothetical protein X777_11821 [Ooceraea biroi]|uniref:C2H2-type domain-containing protein n=1 Tax=Ooceraea biroi TaxID=2015173 RepID=A0A026W190_OOCBI|nr:hypothetical protein X777_11821 [Ooceraea biroi]